MSVFRLPFTILVFLLLVSQQLLAQSPTDTTKSQGIPLGKTGSIKGKLVDAQNEPVSYATVTLLRADSSVVNGDLSQDDGSFKITPTGIGSFFLRIQALGIAT